MDPWQKVAAERVAADIGAAYPPYEPGEEFVWAACRDCDLKGYVPVRYLHGHVDRNRHCVASSSAGPVVWISSGDVMINRTEG